MDCCPTGGEEVSSQYRTFQHITMEELSDLHASKSSCTGGTSPTTTLLLSHPQKVKELTTNKKQTRTFESGLSPSFEYNRRKVTLSEDTFEKRFTVGDSNQTKCSETEEKVEKKKRTRKPHAVQWKKPKGMPKRPLSAYNYFFQREREEMMKVVQIEDNIQADGVSEKKRRRRKRKVNTRAHTKSSGLGFANLARTVSTKWKTLDTETKAIYESLAKADKERYQKELEIWRMEQENANLSKDIVLKNIISSHAETETLALEKAAPAVSLNLVDLTKGKLSVTTNWKTLKSERKEQFGFETKKGNEIYIKDLSNQKKNGNSSDSMGLANPAPSYLEARSFATEKRIGNQALTVTYGNTEGRASLFNTTEQGCYHPSTQTLKDDDICCLKPYMCNSVHNDSASPSDRMRDPAYVLQNRFHEDTLQISTAQHVPGHISRAEYWCEYGDLGKIRSIEELQAANYKLCTLNASSSIQILDSQLDDDAADFLTSLKYYLS